MTKGIFSDLENEKLIRSAIYLFIAVTMVAASIPSGVLKGNSFGVLLSNTGLILFFYAMLRPWANAKYYFVQFAILFVIFSILQLIRIIFQFELTEDIMWFAGGVCIDAFIGSIIGIIAFSEGFRCTLYTAANIALLAIFIMFPQTLSPDPELTNSEIISACISLIFQVVSVAIFYRSASIAENNNSSFRILILFSVIALILMGIWGILAFEITDWLFGIRIWSFLEIVSALFALYAFFLTYDAEYI
ncbi:MAG TPA: hypothetical protein VK213_05765 [Bacteroidales bacterium]|nr:hypothetical protein [Bacteroidales bacterium]